MEILRARLFENNYGIYTVHDIMPKTRGGRRDGLPCKAKRRLFVDDSPAGIENSQAEANLRDKTDSSSKPASLSERLRDKYTDIEVFQDPPTPYRAVCHSAGERNGLDSTKKVEQGGENVGTPSTVAESKRSSSKSASRKQSRLQEFYKPKKRVRTSVTPLLKTPEGPIRTRSSGRRGLTPSCEKR